MSSTMTRDEAVTVAEAAIQAVVGGALADLLAVVHVDATNREATAEPPATRGRGPQAFHATGRWLRDAFSDLTWTTERSIAEGDLVVTFGTMSGRHTGNLRRLDGGREGGAGVRADGQGVQRAAGALPADS